MAEDLIRDLADSLGQWAYLLVAFMATAETAAFLGFIAPGEFTIILGGVLAGEGTLSLPLLIGIVWTSIVLGDSIGFLLGRRLGRGFVARHGHRVRLTEERVRRVDSYFARHGGKTIFFGRWVGFVRPLMPFTAGASGLPYKRFLPYDVLSAGLFGTTFCLLGYIFWRSFDKITSIAGRGALAFGVLVALILGGVLAFKRLRHAENRARLAAWLERAGRRPALRPLAAVIRAAWRAVLRPLWIALLRPIGRALTPPLRFFRGRLTPGGLGIELTTLLAVAAVSAYVFGLYTKLVSDGKRIPADHTALDVARDLHTSFVTTLADAVSVLGSWPVALVVVVAAVALLVWSRRILDAVVLALGFGLTQAGIYLTKDLVDRPRPGAGLDELGGSSFPSGHAGTAATYVALAVIAARALGRLRFQAPLVTVAVGVAAAIGLARVYLRAHYLSDVTSGWALGLAVFALCGAVALVVSFVRNNERVRDPSGREQLSATDQPAVK
jgi:membrane protein DedA with SNARE-associated domain